MSNSNIYKAASAYVDNYITGTKARKITALKDEWRFHAGDIIGAWEPSFDDSSWRVLSIPHDYSIEGEFSDKHAANGFVQSGAAWYKKHFRIHKTPLAEKFYLMFDGVSMNCQVWINDRFLGRHPYAFTPFWYDITPFLKPDEENVISIRVDCSLQPFTRSYTGMGLFRNVWLIAAYSLHIDQWGITYEVTKLTEEEAEISVNTKCRVDRYPETIWNAFSWQGCGMEHNNWIEKTCRLVTSVIDSEGTVVGETEDSALMPNFSKHEFNQLLKVDKPQPWSAEKPYMYTMHSKLYIDGILVDDVLTPLGIRTISYDSENGFLLNNQTVKLKGVCLHQDSGIYGGAVPVQEWVRKLLKLKGAGCNAIRTSHHPFPTEFYHVCDYLGFMVMDEAFDEWKMGWDRGLINGPYGKYIYGYYLYFDQWYETDLRAMLQRDRNHPSVIMWSIGNEIPELYFDEGIDIVKKMVAICKEEDTTRPVTVCAEGNHILRIKEGIMDQVDIPGYNYVSSREGKAYYERFHKEHPDWVMVGSETEFEPEHWKAVIDNPYVIGQFLWAGYDYLGEGADLFGEDANLGNTFDIAALASEKRDKKKKVIRHGWAFGVLDIIGTPKGEYFYRRSVWNDEPCAYLAVKSDMKGRKPYQYFLSHLHWNWNKGDRKTVYCYTNCEKVELFLNGQSVGVKESDKYFPFAVEWDIEYAPGTLKVIGYNNGNKVCENELFTAGKPAKIVLESDTDLLSAGTVDYANITISIVDENDRLVPYASNKLSARIRGCGSLLGIFSGDMTSNASYRADSCHAFRGKCMAVVKVTKDTGPIEVVIEGEGLQPGVLHLQSE